MTMRHARAKEGWTDEEDKLLSLTWGPSVDVRALSTELGRTREAIEQRARKLGLRRTAVDTAGPAG